jgi:hypothetical protein
MDPISSSSSQQQQQQQNEKKRPRSPSPQTVCFSEDFCCFQKECVMLNDEAYCLSCAGDQHQLLLTSAAEYCIVHQLVPADNYMYIKENVDPKPNLDEYYVKRKCFKCNKKLIRSDTVMTCNTCLEYVQKIFEKGIKNGRVKVIHEC